MRTCLGLVLLLSMGAAAPAWAQEEEEPEAVSQSTAPAAAEMDEEPPAPPAGLTEEPAAAAPLAAKDTPPRAVPRIKVSRGGGVRAPAAVPVPSGVGRPWTREELLADIAKGCDVPPLHHINLHLRTGNGNRLIGDATPIVCSGQGGTKFETYCQRMMHDDARRCCPVKPEGHPLRLSCELTLLGKDPEDGVPGPSWSFSGDGGVEKRKDNPFLSYVYGHGVVKACSNVVDKCGEARADVGD